MSLETEPDAVNSAGVHAKYKKVFYGVDPEVESQCFFDLWWAGSNTPLVIFIHGGGFQVGHRWEIYDDPAIPRFLQAGVSFATIDYRYHNDTASPRGVRDSLCDCKRALQFMRSNATEYDIDKTRIGAYGGSGGGGASLWLAFHDNMADSYNKDPVLRESTRLKVVGAKVTQASYDILRWPEILGKELNAVEYRLLKRRAMTMLRIYTEDDLHSAEGVAIRQDLDFLRLMSKEDPPMYVSNNMEKTLDDDVHHPLHVKALWEQATKVGLVVSACARPIGLNSPCEDLVDFFLQHL